MKFKNNLKSYLLVIGLGVAAGLLTTALDFFPYDTLWSFSAIASAFGFWIITTTLIIYFSSSNINAAANAFLYLSSMNFSFYLLKYMIGLFDPRFYSLGGLNWGLLLRFDILALGCAVISILYALPISGLGAEKIGVTVFLFKTHTYLFQLLINILGLALLLSLFHKKITNKPLFIIITIVGSLIGAGVFYLPTIIH